MRPAKIGDQGTLVGLQNYGSIAALLIQVGADQHVSILGDWRMVANLLEAFAGEQVKVVEDEGSAYGAHDIRPVEDAD